MGVMPLPHFKTLYLHFDAYKVNMIAEDSSPSIGELGRLHFTKAEVKSIEKEKRNKEMAFQAFDVSTLPVREFGRKATEPKMGIGENGQVVFNVLVQKAWEGINRVIILFDPESKKLAFHPAKDGAALPKGIVEGKNLLTLTWGRKTTKDASGKTVKTEELDGTLSLKNGSALMEQLGYKYKEARNQSFVLSRDEKSNRMVFQIPATTPTPRPVKKRTSKVVGTVATANGTNGAIVEKVVPPAEEELLEL